jgi:cytochrome c oxidase subunit 2
MRPPRLLIALSTGLFAVPPSIAAAAPQRGSGYGMPPDFSLEGHRIDFLINSVTIPIALLFLIMVGIIVYACIVHADGKHKAVYEHGTGTHSAMNAVIISSVIFFGVDGWLFFWSTKDVDEIFWQFPDSEDALRVEVNAQQWAWNFRQAGPDKVFGTADDIVTINTLTVPTGRNVMLKMTAKDVIHSLYLPNLRVKKDAIPGNTTRTWFHAVKEGELDIACAQHCGTHHFKMRGQLNVLSPADFAAWEIEMTEIGKRSFDPKDPEANWGWPWEADADDNG